VNQRQHDLLVRLGLIACGIDARRQQARVGLVFVREPMADVTVEEPKRRALRDGADPPDIRCIEAAIAEVETPWCVQFDRSGIPEERREESPRLRPRERAERRLLGRMSVALLLDILTDREGSRKYSSSFELPLLWSSQLGTVIRVGYGFAKSPLGGTCWTRSVFDHSPKSYETSARER
jgi:hypothetical protein